LKGLLENLWDLDFCRFSKPGVMSTRKNVIIPDDSSLSIYMQKISGKKTLTHDEEILLCTRIQNGDQKALDDLVISNLRFVISVARNYQGRGLGLSDLISEGNIGLIKAAQKFDSKKNFKFVSYAVWWIRQSILKAVSDQSRLARLPQHCVSKINKIKKFRHRFEQKNSREATIEEIAEGVKISWREVTDLIIMDTKVISLDLPVGESLSFGETIRDDRGFDSIAYCIPLRDKLNKILMVLKKRDREIVKVFFGWNDGVPKTLQHTAEIFHLTKESVRVIVNKSMALLKEECRQ
jgi:RNA polymerase primary sigma factor